jgi:hypothetical protein
MPIPPQLKSKVEAILDTYCQNKVPERVRDKLKIVYKIRGNKVTLVESRPFYMDPNTWTESVVAQFRYDPGNTCWTLYCADRNSRWHCYEGLKPARNLADLLDEVDADPTGIFWG